MDLNAIITQVKKEAEDKGLTGQKRKEYIDTRLQPYEGKAWN